MLGKAKFETGQLVSFGGEGLKVVAITIVDGSEYRYRLYSESRNVSVEAREIEVKEWDPTQVVL